MIKTNLMMGQQLLKKIIISEPDDRISIWLTDVLGGAGKTVFFQSQIENPEIDGLYLRVSKGVERLSAKLRKKIDSRLESCKVVLKRFGSTLEAAQGNVVQYGKRHLATSIGYVMEAIEDASHIPFLPLVLFGQPVLTNKDGRSISWSNITDIIDNLPANGDS